MPINVDASRLQKNKTLVAKIYLHITHIQIYNIYEVLIKGLRGTAKDASRDSLSQELFASSSSSSSSFSISTAIEVAAMASYITMSAVATIASWLPTVLEVARLAYIAQRNSWDSLWLTELPARATPEFQFKERFLVS